VFKRWPALSLGWGWKADVVRFSWRNSVPHLTICCRSFHCCLHFVRLLFVVAFLHVVAQPGVLRSQQCPCSMLRLAASVVDLERAALARALLIYRCVLCCCHTPMLLFRMLMQWTWT
jgi:hypothetical protein